MFALPIFTVWASDRRAVRNCPVDSCRHILTQKNIEKGHIFRCVLCVGITYFHGERADRCRWQREGGERVAAVAKIEQPPCCDDFSGHRNRAVTRQLSSA